ncbi:hypothetical protein HELRODRAFT_181571 [Helobdella robusta]|uniref:Uncharacterized protein n=1 Tax=Helobdella robusta TaxID=6412 RepID=T1FH44_HELRO|nr:hypothetical protein HELRODRAFT_181571 [Helobdella robusta]ESN92371.1 hypothetical protein HELRODRAFT_181571 [Helobdella robusta]
MTRQFSAKATRGLQIELGLSNVEIYSDEVSWIATRVINSVTGQKVIKMLPSINSLDLAYMKRRKAENLSNLSDLNTDTFEIEKKKRRKVCRRVYDSSDEEIPTRKVGAKKRKER